MKTMYLKDGRMVDLISEDVNGKALVAPYIDIYESRGYNPDDYEEIWTQQPSQNMIFVNKEDLTEKSPVVIYDKQIEEKKEQVKTMDAEIKTKKAEVLSLDRDIKELEAKKGDTAKFIFDLSPYRNAKKLVFFRKRYIYPVVIEPDISSYDEDTIPTLQLTMSPGYKKNVESAIKIRYRDRRGYESEEIDDKWGVMINPNEDEIVAKCRERCDTIDLDNVSLYDVHRNKGGDIGYEYLSDKMIAHIEKLEAQKEAARIKTLEDEANKAIEALSKAKGGVFVFDHLPAKKPKKSRP